MDFRSLRYFVTVAEELNFTRAAERLHMSQPPLSNQIRDMEEDMGVKLFIRGKRNLRLTEEGLLLYRRALQILDLADKTREEITSLGKELSGRICIGTVEGRAPFLAAKWIAGFQEEYPLVTYSMWNGSGDDVQERLGHGLIDLGILAAPYDTEHLDGFSIGGEPWVAMLPAKHPLAMREGQEILLRELLGEPLIIPQRSSRVEAIRRWFGEIGGEPEIFCTLSNYMDALALVEQGVGISIFPQTTVTPNPKVVQKLIVEPAKAVEYVLVWMRKGTQGELVRVFVEYVEDYLAEDRVRVREAEDAAMGFEIPEGTQLL